MRNYNKTILVIGGMGFVGSHFVELLNAKYNNDRIIVIDKEETKNLDKVRDTVVFEKIDINKSEHLFKLYDIDIVINFIPQQIKCNVKRFIQVLSWNDDPVQSDIVIRLARCYGPRQQLQKFIPKSIINAVSRELVMIKNDGSSMYDWIYISDCCSAIECILNHGKSGITYVAKTNIKISEYNIIRKILMMLELPLSFVENIENVIEMQNDFADDNKNVIVPNWQAKIKIDDGLRNCISTYNKIENVRNV